MLRYGSVSKHQKSQHTYASYDKRPGDWKTVLLLPVPKARAKIVCHVLCGTSAYLFHTQLFSSAGVFQPNMLSRSNHAFGLPKSTWPDAVHSSLAASTLVLGLAKLFHSQAIRKHLGCRPPNLDTSTQGSDTISLLNRHHYGIPWGASWVVQVNGICLNITYRT